MTWKHVSKKITLLLIFVLSFQMCCGNMQRVRAEESISSNEVAEEQVKIDSGGTGYVGIEPMEENNKYLGEKVVDITDGVLIEEKYYFTEWFDSQYEFDSTRYSSDGTTIFFTLNWTKTPHLADDNGKNGGVWVNIISQDGTEKFDYDFYCFEGGWSLSKSIDLESYADGEYDLLIHLNNNCAVSTVCLYKYNGRIYFGAGFGGLSGSSLEKYSALYEKMDNLDCQEINNKYMCSSYSTYYKNICVNGKNIVDIANEITEGCDNNYEKARMIYEYIGCSYGYIETSEAQDIMVAMLNFVGIPATKLTKTQYEWVCFYVNDEWKLCSPYMALHRNNVGYFDTSFFMFCWELDNQVIDLYKYEDDNGKDTLEVQFEGLYDRTEAYEVLELVNSYRLEAGLQKLTMDEELVKAAEYRACEINFYYGHTRPNEMPLGSLTLFAQGENIAYGYKSAQEVMQAWMNSSGHRANILYGDYASIGIGCFTQGDTQYWVQLFGTKVSQEAVTRSNETRITTINVLRKYLEPQFKDSRQNMMIADKLNYPLLLKNLGASSQYSIPDSNYIYYASLNKDVALVNSKGTVAGIASGTAVITGTIYGVLASYDLEVQSGEDTLNDNCRDCIITVYDKDFESIPIAGAKVVVDDVYYETLSDGTVHIKGNQSKPKSVFVSKREYVSQKLDLNLSENVNIYLEKAIEFRIQFPEIKTEVKLENSIDIAGHSLKWLNMKYKLDIELGKEKNLQNGLKSTMPMTIERDTKKKTLKITIGVGQADGNGSVNADSYNRMKNLCDGIGTSQGAKAVHDFMKKHGYEGDLGELGVKINTKIMGYVELDYNGNVLESGAVVAMDGSGSLTWRPAFGAGIVYIKGTLSLSAEGKLVMNFRNNDISFSAEISLKQALKIAGGVGNSNLHLEVGAEGSLSEKIIIPFKNVQQSLNISISAKVYVEAQIFIFKGKAEKKLVDVTLIPWSKEKMTANQNINKQGVQEVQLVRQLEMEKRDYRSGIRTVRNNGELYQENVYPNGTSELCCLSDGTLLAVWTADCGNKAAENRTTLVYSVNEGNGWNKPQAVCETGRGDFYPSLVVEGNKAYLVYINIGKVLREGVSPDEMFANTDIYVAEFSEGTFGIPQLITEKGNDILEMEVDIACDGSNLAIVWIENSLNNPFRDNGVNSIWSKEFKDGIWQEKKCLVGELSMISDMDVAWDEGSLYVAYTMDMDDNPETSSDMEMFLYSEGKTTQITLDYRVDKNPVFQKNELYWLSDEEIMYLKDMHTPTSIELTGVSCFQMCGYGDRKIISFLQEDGFRNELYIVEGKENSFSVPVPFSDFGAHISSYAVSSQASGELAGIFFVNEMQEEQLDYGETAMYIYDTLTAENLILQEVYHDEFGMEVGQNIPVKLNLFNQSNKVVNNVRVKVVNEEKVILNEVISCNINPGTEETVIMEYPLDEIENHRVSITVLPLDFQDSDLTDNVLVEEIGLADVSIKDALITLTENGGILAGSICNEGYKEATQVEFEVISGGQEGIQLHYDMCGTLAVGAEYAFEYEIGKDYFDFIDENEGKYFFLKCSSATEEGRYDNNSANIVVFPAKVEGISLEQDFIELEVKNSTKLEASIFPANAMNQTIYYLTDNNSVAIVDDKGIVVAVQEGIAKITAVTSDGGYSVSCWVIVEKTEDNEMNGWHMNQSNCVIEKGNIGTLAIVDELENAVNSSIAWKSSNPEIATVNSDGKIVALAAGTAYITAYAENGFADCCIVTVSDLELQAIILDEEKIDLMEGQERVLNVYYVPDNTTTSRKVVWSSSDETVAVVSQEGIVMAIQEGEAVIMALAENGKEVQCQVNVQALPRYTVCFDSDLGDEPIEVTNIVSGSTIDLPDDPVKEGLVFEGWYVERKGQGLRFTEETPIKSNMTVYALWGNFAEYKKGLRITKIQPQIYTGKAIKPMLEVYDGATLLREKIDYTVSYKNNKTPNDASHATKAPTVTIKGKGNYTGSVTATFSIIPKNLADGDIEAGDLTVVSTGKIQKPVPTVTRDGKKLKNKTDFTLEYPDTSDGAYKLPGVYTIKIKAKQGGGYTGERTVTLTILPDTSVPVSKLTIAKIPAMAYQEGTLAEPPLTVKYKGKKLQQGVDYAVAYENNEQAGTARAVLTGLDGSEYSYVGTRTVTFKITGTSISRAQVTIHTGEEGIEYDGTAKNPELTVTVAAGGQKTQLRENTDYTLEYGENTKAGKGTVLIKGMGGYTGTLKKTFNIRTYNINNDKITIENRDALTAVYEKSGAKPEMHIFFDGKELTAGTDYTVSFQNNKKISGREGTKVPKVTIKGKGNFTGTLSLPFEITQKPLSPDTPDPIAITAADVTLNSKGNYRTKLTLKDSAGKKLTEKKDYVITGYYLSGESGGKLPDQAELSVGTELKVTLEGIGNYTGTAEALYRVTANSLTKVSFKISPQTYTGEEIRFTEEDMNNPQIIRVNAGKGKDLPVYGTDYIITGYSHNVQKGKATVTFQGISDAWGGSKTVTFRITSKKMKWFWDLLY